jgi:hypothetical protein
MGMMLPDEKAKFEEIADRIKNRRAMCLIMLPCQWLKFGELYYRTIMMKRGSSVIYKVVLVSGTGLHGGVMLDLLLMTMPRK